MVRYHFSLASEITNAGWTLTPFRRHEQSSTAMALDSAPRSSGAGFSKKVRVVVAAKHDGPRYQETVIKDEAGEAGFFIASDDRLDVAGRGRRDSTRKCHRSLASCETKDVHNPVSHAQFVGSW